MERIIQKIKEAGIFQYGIVNPSEINYRQEIREICKGNSCQQYGKTWACPPAVGTLIECKNRCLQYDTMIVFTGKFVIADNFDFEGMVYSMKEFKKISHDLDRVIKPYLKNYIILSNEGCGMCNTCTYPDEPCRFPEKLQHSIEGYGILVSQLAEMANVNYNNGENTITYFGALLFNGLDII
jgi:predicted metal-binding protein